MSLRDVLIEWLESGVEPDGTADLDATEQRDLVADIYTVEPGFMVDALVESFTRKPESAAEVVAALRSADFAQLGAVMDRVLRSHLIGSPWLESELRETHEQESTYDGDQ